MKFKTRHEIVVLGLVVLVQYLTFPTLMLIAINSGMWVCDFCLASILDPQDQAFRKTAKTLALLTFFGELFGIIWITRLLLVRTLRTIRSFKQQHPKQVTSRT